MKKPKPKVPEKPITLEQYAGVTAALAEGFGLDSVLAQEKLEPDQWKLGSADWRAQLVAGGPNGPLFTDFRRHLTRAEDTLNRKVTPLDADPLAWVGFLKVYSKSTTPDEVLRGLDLGPNDLSRLSRFWAGRAKADEGVREKLGSAAALETAPLPGIQAAPRVLRRFPWSPPEPAAPAPAPAVTPASAEGKAPEASGEALSVQVPSFMRPGERLGPMVPLVATAEAPPAAPPPSLVAPPASVMAPPVSGMAPPVSAMSPPASAMAPPPPSIGNSPAPAALAAEPPPHPLASTAHGVVLPVRASLPFQQKETPADMARTAVSPGIASAARAAAAANADPAGRVSTGTAPVFKLPSNLPLPFVKKLAEQKPAPGAPAPAKPAHEKPAAAPAPAPKALSLEQHAAMSLEATVLSRHLESVLHRYGIDAATKTALDAYYRDLVAENAEARATWHGAYQAHYARWQSGRKP